MSLYDDLTLDEQVNLWCKFRRLRQNIDTQEFTRIIQLSQHSHKKLRNFSSGMRQRVKLGLAILSESQILLLDEPVSHLDANAIAWFQETLTSHIDDRSLLVASNSDPDETFLCDQLIDVQQFKKVYQTS
jgi:ABC-type multidrug transport system ATPase subunit